MECLKCGSANVIRNGGGRIRCKDCGSSPRVIGESTLYGADGEVKLTWRKTAQDDKLAALQEAGEAIIGRIKPKKPAPGPKSADSDLLNCYVITDFHLGMLSWHGETGEDWDTDIAEQMLLDWFSLAIQRSPKAGHAVFAQLGDFLHWDGLEAVTPTSQHSLDADTRFTKLVRVAMRSIRRVVDMLLRRHDRVTLLLAEGNHDIASSVWLREMFAALYADEPRIEVITRADPYYCVEHGATSLFFHHGHLKRPKAIDDVFAAKFREVFGRTRHSYAHLGHMHHIDTKETNLMVVEQHRTLAAKDAYASRGGWIAGRDAKVITYHREYGEASRLTINPEMVRDGR